MRKLVKGLISVTVVFVLLGFSIGVVQAGTCELPNFSADNFDNPADNPYLSRLNSIGHTYVYEAETEDGLIRDYQYFSPSPAIPILDVDCTEVYDVEYLLVEDLDGGAWVIQEETWDWYAWDNDGNFWYFGEDTSAHTWNDDWTACTTSTEGAWEAGVDGALPGIILPADPHPGDCVQQEYYEGEAEDRGKILRLNAKVTLKNEDSYENCLKTKEWTKLDPGNVEHKYYAQDDSGLGLGLVYVEELKEKTVIFELVDYYPGPPDLPIPVQSCP